MEREEGWSRAEGADVQHLIQAESMGTSVMRTLYTAAATAAVTARAMKTFMA